MLVIIKHYQHNRGKGSRLHYAVYVTGNGRKARRLRKKPLTLEQCNGYVNRVRAKLRGQII